MPNRNARTGELNRLRLLAIPLIGSVSLLLAFTYLGVAAQHAAGVYSQGQILYIQGHTHAVRRLDRYAERGDRRDLLGAYQALRVPDAYRESRLALERRPVDRERAADGFTSTGIDRGDAERAARFFPVFKYVGAVRRTIDSWRESDAQFDSLRVYAGALQIARDRNDTAAIAGLRERIDAADDELTRLERVFASGIADASRILPPIVLLIGTLLGALLVVGSVLTLRGVARTADRARAEQLEYFARLNTLMEGVPDLIAWIDRAGRYTYVNAAVEQLVGRPREQIIGMAQRELATGTGMDAGLLKAWESGLERSFDGEQDTAMVLEIPNAAGKVHLFQFRLAVQHNDSGEAETVMAIGRDITALRESEAALRDRETQLRHAQKLEAIGRLAGGVAHEFNNILTAITANIELALLELPETDETRLELLAALAAARRAGGLTRQLLVFGRPDAIEVRHLDLGRFLAELEPMLQRLAGDNVQVVATQRSGDASMMGDAGQLQQILFNLVSNARDAMPDGGTIQIDLDTVTTDDLCRNHAFISGNIPPTTPGDPAVHWTAMTVRDTGTGMTKETVDRLFEPFFTTKAPGEGASTVFGSASTNVPHGDGEIVLLVEDEAPVRAAARRMLEHAGYHVLAAKHADDAMLQWEQQRANIVVTDFMMPGVDGAGLLRRRRVDSPDLPALIVSGYTGGGTIDESALGENTVLLQKPFTRADLLQNVRELLDAAR